MVPLFGFAGMFLGWMMSLLSIFLILLVLVQRGRGGGLTGALGGPGGQSAFGSKAGDMFTKITSVAALLWIALCALATASLGEKPIVADDVLTPDVPAMESRSPEDRELLSFPPPEDPNAVPESTTDADMEALGGGTLGAAPAEETAPPADAPAETAPPADAPPADAPPADAPAADAPAADAPADADAPAAETTE